MSKIINDYLARLKSAMPGADAAMIQDALSDAEEHLRTAYESARKEDPGRGEPEILESIIRKFGAPEEVASAYMEIEERAALPFHAPLPPAVPGKKSAARSFFGVFTDPKAYGAIFYMLFSLLSGIFYFTWAVTGLSMSMGLLILIIGVPFILIFLISVRGLALVEGKIVEALLGVRMPRRPIFARKDLKFTGRVKYLLTDSMTWKTILYMVLMLPLGVIYFDLLIIFLSLSLWGIFRPLFEYGFDLPYMTLGRVSYYTPGWMMPVAMLVGVLWLFMTMHMAKGVGRMHGRIAKSLLVRD